MPYAHRGAYPCRHGAACRGLCPRGDAAGRAGRNSRLINPLVMVWTAQNVLLVLSSILRLNLYVEAYSLTYLRVAAFIWMGLVAVGLVLIVAQIVLRNHDWLVAVCQCRAAAPRALRLLLCQFAGHDRQLTTSRIAEEIQRRPVRFRVPGWLGPQAIPALGPLSPAFPEIPSPLSFRHSRNRLAAAAPGKDWRAWSFQAWRLSRYLTNESLRLRLPVADYG